jgi:exopolysaccharide biosynthesis polyprenyl glycosylphosphotransferase
LSETAAVRDLAPESIGVSAQATRWPSAGRRLRWLSRLLPLYDAFAIAVALGVAHGMNGASPATAGEMIGTLVVGAIIWVAVLHLFGAYPDRDEGGSSDLRRMIGACAMGTLGLSIVSVWWSRPIPRPSLAAVFAIALGLEVFGRSLIRAVSVRARRDGSTALRTAIVGTNDEAYQLARSLSSRRDFVPIGLIDVSGTGNGQRDGIPVVGSLLDTEAVLEANGVECVYVASSAISPSQIESVSRACRRARVELRISTNVVGIHPSRLLVRSVEGLTALSVKPVRLSGYQTVIKRTFDIVIGSLALLIAMPFIAMIAVAIRLTSRGPAFFRQQRVTKDGRTFTMYKFRSMVIDPERALEGKTIDLTKPFFKLEDDPRLTRFGSALRSLSLDELPQLWNVIRGDMSLVGPRPLPLEQVEANRDFLAPRHEVRGGLTGLWQVSGRSELDSEEALRMDCFYIENWSLNLDIRILLKTFGAVLARRGAL